GFTCASFAKFFPRAIAKLAILRTAAAICNILTVNPTDPRTIAHRETEMSDDTAGILVPPPLIFLGALVLGFGLDAVAPLGWPWPATWLAVVAATVLAGVGVAIVGWQFATFRRVGTPVSTSLPA